MVASIQVGRLETTMLVEVMATEAAKNVLRAVEKAFGFQNK
jgi:hypothetical protein